MNPLDWRKSVALVSQHKKEAAITETDQLSSMPLSEISIDDSGPPVVYYGSQKPVAAGTPTGTPHTCTAHHRKILIRRSFQISLRVHYTLLYHLLVQH